MQRAVPWEGFQNARELGGLPTADGRSTRTGVLVRSADTRHVTPSGWASAHAAGFRTVLDLRNDDEVVDAPAPVLLTHTRIPIDDADDVEFWRRLDEQLINGTPLYFRPFLEHKPSRAAAAVTAVAEALPRGGVIFHCRAGRDRTGLLTLLLLSLAGVPPETICEDYELTADLYPCPDGHTTRSALLSALDDFDAAAYLTAAGVDPAHLTDLRARLIA